jgi:hypothetical protein
MVIYLVSDVKHLVDKVVNGLLEGAHLAIKRGQAWLAFALYAMLLLTCWFVYAFIVVPYAHVLLFALMLFYACGALYSLMGATGSYMCNGNAYQQLYEGIRSIIVVAVLAKFENFIREV